MTPEDYKHPEWDKAHRVHDWKNHISEKLQAMWHTFTDAQKQAIAESAEKQANAEEWD